MRTIEELKSEIAMRKVLGLPRITLTPEERARAFGDPSLAQREPYAYEKMLAQRLQDGLPMSIADKKTARKYLKNLKENMAGLQQILAKEAA